MTEYKSFPRYDLADPKGYRPATFRAQPLMITIKGISPQAADKAALIIRDGLREKKAVVEGPFRRPVYFGHWSLLDATGVPISRGKKPFQIWKVELFVYDFDYPAVDAMHWLTVPMSVVIEISKAPKERVDAYLRRREKARAAWEQRQLRKQMRAEQERVKAQ